MSVYVPVSLCLCLYYAWPNNMAHDAWRSQDVQCEVSINQSNAPLGLFCVGGLWVREESGPRAQDVDVLRHSGVRGSRDHPQQGP